MTASTLVLVPLQLHISDTSILMKKAEPHDFRFRLMRQRDDLCQSPTGWSKKERNDHNN